MQRNDSLSQTSIYWLFNTPYAVKLDGVSVGRHHSRKNTPGAIVVRLVDGRVCTFHNQPIPAYASSEHTALAVRDAFDEVRWMTFVDADEKNVALKQVYKWIDDHEVYGMSRSKYLSIAAAVCNGATTADLAKQWHCSEQHIKVLIEKLGFSLRVYSGRNPHLTPVRVQLSASRLHHDSQYWLSILDEYKPYLKERNAL